MNPVFGVLLNLSIPSATNESRAFAGIGRVRRFDLGGVHASARLTRGRFGRASVCCNYAPAGAGSPTRPVFPRLFERHGGGGKYPAGALLYIPTREERARF